MSRILLDQQASLKPVAFTILIEPLCCHIQACFDDSLSSRVKRLPMLSSTALVFALHIAVTSQCILLLRFRLTSLLSETLDSLSIVMC